MLVKSLKKLAELQRKYPLVILGIIAIIVQTVGYTANLVLFGKLTGIFADSLSPSNCSNQEHGFTPKMSGNGCIFDIGNNISKYNRLSRLLSCGF
mgnify:CR=1 FL=1